MYFVSYLLLAMRLLALRLWGLIIIDFQDKDRDSYGFWSGAIAIPARNVGEAMSALKSH